MKNFMDQDFLLESETARHLYHDYAAKMPIVDYHCHISPREIYETGGLTIWLRYGWAESRLTALILVTITSGASCAQTGSVRIMCPGNRTAISDF